MAPNQKKLTTVESVKKDTNLNNTTVDKAKVEKESKCDTIEESQAPVYTISSLFATVVLRDILINAETLVKLQGNSITLFRHLAKESKGLKWRQSSLEEYDEIKADEILNKLITALDKSVIKDEALVQEVIKTLMELNNTLYIKVKEDANNCMTAFVLTPVDKWLHTSTFKVSIPEKAVDTLRTLCTVRDLISATSIGVCNLLSLVVSSDLESWIPAENDKEY